MNTYSQYHIPDIFAPKRVKDKDEFAKSVARYILGSTSGYRAKMAIKYKDNRDVYQGKQSLEYLRDLLQVEENSTYFNIKFTPRPVAKKIIRLIVSGYLKDEEAVNATALSKHIADRKNRSRLQAKFRMENKELIAGLSEMAGLPLTSSEDFTPDSEEELELYTAMNDKEVEETLMQDTLTYILNANDVNNLKNLAIRELCINNLFGVYEYVDSLGRPKFDPIYAEDAIIPFSMYEDFQDGSFFGRWITMHIADIRRRFKIKATDEKEFFKVADNLVNGRLSKTYGDYNSSWEYGERPYDKDTVRVLHVWWKCSKVYEYVEGVKDGKPYFDYWHYEGFTPHDKVSGIQDITKIDYKTPPTAYEGYFLGGGDFVLEWGEQENIPFDGSSQDVRSPFIFHMPENTGTMDINSMVHMMKDSIEGMDQAILQIKRQIASLAPDGYIVDVRGLAEMDLGTGSILNPLNVLDIAKQTGNLFYTSEAEDGTPIQPPIRPNISTIGDKLNGLITIYNFELENIRNYLGMNEFRDGTANKSRTAAAFAQAQLDQSNMATEFIYRGWTRIMNSAVKNLGLRTWYELKYGSKDKGLLRYLGSTNIKFIEAQKDIIATAFDFEYAVVLTKEEKTLLEQTMASAVSAGTLTTEDVILIRQVKNAQVAHKYLTFLAKKRRKESMEEAERNQKSAAEYAALSGERVEQAKQETVKMAADMEMAKEKKRGENQIEAEMTKGALSLLLHYTQSGQQMPEQYKPLVDFIMQSASSKIEKSRRITDREIGQMDQEDQLAQAEAELNMAVESGEITPEQRDQALGLEE